MALLKPLEAKAWNKRTTGDIFITDNEYFHRNANYFVNANPSFKHEVFSSLNSRLSNLDFSTKKHKSKKLYYPRITAGSLNSAIKKQLDNHISDLKFEVTFEEGVFYYATSKKVKGFDFAKYDDTLNIKNFHNYCFGRRGIIDGFSLWDTELSKRADWKTLASLEGLPDQSFEGIDIVAKKEKPIIIGELQFGNWALLYYDLFKAIHIERFMAIDALIYVVADGNLADYISDGTVNFEKARRAIDQYTNLINVPIWLIGIDIR
ncbi:hypothetical protein LCM10_04795 [Rossellomorea aquimaris]|uniref:BglII/BstYI family type II restriction endonuclease n=1 Tax=Rossellomorea aquimaris TaxID=189382 RepID=UPI001CD51D1A|nr:BglII/BstYI family type II restriction endonuclease [Rossellomorea aquimaris]MCA1054297.1 hypothetical protein [Rossellomorea aquimaris]